jgi:hypothetical protein
MKKQSENKAASVKNDQKKPKPTRMNSTSKSLTRWLVVVVVGIK